MKKNRTAEEKIALVQEVEKLAPEMGIVKAVKQVGISDVSYYTWRKALSGRNGQEQPKRRKAGRKPKPAAPVQEQEPAPVRTQAPARTLNFCPGCGMNLERLAKAHQIADYLEENGLSLDSLRIGQ